MSVRVLLPVVVFLSACAFNFQRVYIRGVRYASCPGAEEARPADGGLWRRGPRWEEEKGDGIRRVNTREGLEEESRMVG